MCTRIPTFGARTDDTDRATVLVVDDEVGPRESLRLILDASCETLTAANASDALEILRTRPVDLITVDLNMPGMKGPELVRTVREEFPRLGVIIVTGYATVETALDGIRLGINDYLTKPFDVVQVTASVKRAVGEIASRRRLVLFLESIGDVLGRQRSAGEMIAELSHNSALQDRLRSLLTEPALRFAEPTARVPGMVDSVALLEVLAEAIEQRDVFMRGHARRVAHYAGLLAGQLCQSSEERELVRIASFMHDIGKVGVASDVIRSRERLDGEQHTEIARHATLGERLVQPLGFSAQIASAIRHHHERWDGAGYPDGLAGEAIPLSARIVGLADAYDAMTCSRPYQHARCEREAIDELRKESGRQFDPALVEAFASLIEAGVTPLETAREGEAW